MVKLLTTKSPDAVRAFLLPRVLGNGIAIAPAAREEVKEVVRSQDLEEGILVIPTCDFDGSTRGRMRDEEHLPACVLIGEIHTLCQDRYAKALPKTYMFNVQDQEMREAGVGLDESLNIITIGP